jgi:hypothetical protein
MSQSTQELAEKVMSIKNMMVARATGGGSASDSDYQQLRVEVLDHPLTKTNLPSCVRTCRTLGEFWGFIKPKFGTYQERSEFLRTEFDPVLSVLENGSRSPADAELTDGLKKSAAEYIQLTWRKAVERRADDPEGAITAARSLLESVCKHLLDEMGESYDDKADLPKLYGLTANKLNLAPSQHTEQVFKQILGGCHAIVEALGSLRNQLSDAHGKGKAGVRPHARHAQLAVNLAGSVAMFLVETLQAKSVPERKT